VGGDARRRLATVARLDELEAVVAGFDPTLGPAPGAPEGPRGTQSGPQTVTLPARWIRDRHELTPPLSDVSGSGG